MCLVVRIFFQNQRCHHYLPDCRTPCPVCFKKAGVHIDSSNSVHCTSCFNKLTFTVPTISSKDLNVEECLWRKGKTNYNFCYPNAAVSSKYCLRTAVFYLIDGTLMVWASVLGFIFTRQNKEKSVNIKWQVRCTFFLKYKQHLHRTNYYIHDLQISYLFIQYVLFICEEQHMAINICRRYLSQHCVLYDIFKKFHRSIYLFLNIGPISHYLTV